MSLLVYPIACRSLFQPLLELFYHTIFEAITAIV